MFENVKTIYSFFKIQKQLTLYFNECNIKNSLNHVPETTFTYENFGFIFKFDIKGICTYDFFISTLSFFSDLICAYDFSYSKELSIVIVEFYLNNLDDIKIPKLELKDYEFLIGYNIKSPVILNIKKYPHLLISGLSNQGKTYMIKSILYNLNKDIKIYMLNFFKEDFQNYNFNTFINDPVELLNFLINFKKNCFYYTEKPRFIFIDELMLLSQDKKIQSLLKDYLCVARHYNIYLICIIQVARSEDLKCKTLFNARVSFKQVDKSSYNVVLGTYDIDYKDLQIREFYCNFNKLKCKTYLF